MCSAPTIATISSNMGDEGAGEHGRIRDDYDYGELQRAECISYAGVQAPTLECGDDHAGDCDPVPCNGQIQRQLDARSDYDSDLVFFGRDDRDREKQQRDGRADHHVAPCVVTIGVADGSVSGTATLTVQ